jgi:hypothetical protein
MVSPYLMVRCEARRWYGVVEQQLLGSSSMRA